MELQAEESKTTETSADTRSGRLQMNDGDATPNDSGCLNHLERVDCSE